MTVSVNILTSRTVLMHYKLTENSANTIFTTSAVFRAIDMLLQVIIVSLYIYRLIVSFFRYHSQILYITDINLTVLQKGTECLHVVFVFV